jgi:alpha-beta hydrolase superfamily lysophospholipase
MSPGLPPEVERSAEEIAGEKGRRLYVRRWSRTDKARPGRFAVVLVHGYAEHSGRYDHVGAGFAEGGAATWAMDLRGHGRSDGPRADIERLEWVLADLDQLVGRAGEGVVMFGHSMGGALAAAYAATRPGVLGGLVLSAPAVHLASAPGWQVWPVRALARVAPGAGVARVAPEGLSRDPQIVQSFVEDPLVWHGRAPARTVIEMYRAGRLALGAAGGLTVPLLVLHGEADPIVPVSSSRAFFSAAASPDKDLVVLPGMRHEPHQELGREAVLALVVAWAARHSASAKL